MKKAGKARPLKKSARFALFGRRLVRLRLFLVFGRQRHAQEQARHGACEDAKENADDQLAFSAAMRPADERANDDAQGQPDFSSHGPVPFACGLEKGGKKQIAG